MRSPRNRKSCSRPGNPMIPSHFSKRSDGAGRALKSSSAVRCSSRRLAMGRGRARSIANWADFWRRRKGRRHAGVRQRRQPGDAALGRPISRQRARLAFSRHLHRLPTQRPSFSSPPSLPPLPFFFFFVGVFFAFLVPSSRPCLFRGVVGRAEKGLCDFHLIVLGAWLQYSTPAGSIMFPGDGAEWITVGAIDPAVGDRTTPRAVPTRRARSRSWFRKRRFPWRVASDRFPAHRRPRRQAAGLAALIWSRHRNWSAHEVRDCLQRSAVDIGPPVHDFETGFGRLALPSLR